MTIKTEILDSDTDSEIDEMMISRYQAMSSLEKVKRIHDLIAATRALAVMNIREKFPGISDREVQFRLAERYIPKPLLKAAFAWDPSQ